MKKQSKLTLIGLVVVILTIIFVILIMLPAVSIHPKRGFRVVCGTNLKGLGTAMAVYAHDYDGKYPQLGNGPWSKRLGYSFDDKEFPAPTYAGSCTITSSWYLLIREADVSPRCFVSPDSKQVEFEGENSHGLDIIELWDFGSNPHNHVSYAFHNPYGKFPANESLPSSFAVAADMNPWLVNGDFVKPRSNSQPPQLLTLSDSLTKKEIQRSNASNHEYEGQHVVFADGHASFEKRSDVGVKNDNIYTYWSTEENPTEQDIQGGTAPTSRSPENDAKSKDDSFLAI